MKRILHSKPLQIIVLILAAAAVILLIYSGETGKRGDTPDTTPETSSTTPASATSVPPASTSAVIPEETEAPAPTIAVGSDVTIETVPMKADAKPDRTPGIRREDPEYLSDREYGDQFLSAEGKIYKNDRTVTYTWYDPHFDYTFSFRFGNPTGEYNRWIYLNPYCVDADFIQSYHCSASEGVLVTIPAEDQSSNNYTVRRALDQRSNAEYVDLQHPGLVWYSEAPIDGPVSIDIIVFAADTMETVIRVWLEKDEDGCWYISDIDSGNLLEENDGSVFTEEELDYIYEMALADFKNPEKTFMSIGPSNFEKPKDMFIIDYREPSEGCYYQYFVPADGSLTAETRQYQFNPILAVSMRNYNSGLGLTLYYHIIHPPVNGSHGTYQYIGRDYPLINSIEVLKNLGYPGSD